MESAWLRDKWTSDLEVVLSSPALSGTQRDTLRRLDALLQRRGIALCTRHFYAANARRLARFLNKPFEEATREDLEGFVDETSKRSAAGTVLCVKRFLKAFYQLLLAPDFGQQPPALVAWIRLRQAYGVSKLPQDLLKPAEILRLADATTHPRDRALIMVLYDSAARVSELISARIGDVETDAYGARLVLRGKTGTRYVRLLHSVPDLLAWINCHPFKHDQQAPLFISWGHQNRYRALLYDGVYKVLRNAVKLAALEKRVHPHLFRHSRLTELAKFLSEAKLKVFAGWAGNSSMARIYVHLSGDDVDRALLEEAGLLKNEGTQQAIDPLAPRVCLRCKTKNSATARHCDRCMVLLDEKELLCLADVQDKLIRNLPLLERIAKDPRIRELLGENLKADRVSGPSTVPQD